jgi:hypothetical protein
MKRHRESSSPGFAKQILGRSRLDSPRILQTQNSGNDGTGSAFFYQPILALVLLILVAACARGTENYTPTPFSFVGQPPMKINVGQVRVVPAYQPPMNGLNIDHTFPTPPAKAVGQWVCDRLIAAGTQGIMEITIEDGSVRETLLPKKTGIEGWFTDDQEARYDANLRVTMRLYNGADALAVATGDVTVTNSHTINEKASVAEREKLFDTMTREIMAQFEGEANARLSQYFAAYRL